MLLDFLKIGGYIFKDSIYNNGLLLGINYAIKLFLAMMKFSWRHPRNVAIRINLQLRLELCFEGSVFVVVKNRPRLPNQLAVNIRHRNIARAQI